MRKKISQGIILVVITFKVCMVFAYEIGTHARITNAAITRSSLNGDVLTSELGIEDGIEPFGSVYYDLSGQNVRSRNKNVYEQSNGRMPIDARPQSISGWLMRGAIREDDIPDYLVLCPGERRCMANW